MKTNTVKVEDLKVGMTIAFRNTEGIDIDGYDIKINTPYKVVEKKDDGKVKLDIGDKGYLFPLYKSETSDIYIWEKQNDLPNIWNGIYLGGSVALTPVQDIKLLDRTIGTLEILTKYYDSIPSELILELIAMNKTELAIK